MIIYTCPKRGGNIYHTCVCTLPPIDVWVCRNCGWRYEEKDDIEYRPFNTESTKVNDEWIDYEAFDNIIAND